MEKTRSWSLCRRSAPLRPKKLVGAHRPHVDRLRLRPAEQVRIKGEGGLPFARVQLVPAGQPRSARRRPLGRLLAQSPEQNKTGALWVGNNREPADAGDVLGRLVDGAAGLLDPARGDHRLSIT